MSNILIIDDEENLRKLLARVVELEGYTVFQAGSIKEGLKLLGKESVNVVISDVKLPDGNGVDLAGKIKKEYPSIEIIVLTAYGTIPDGVKAIKNGAFDYVTKGEHQEKIIPLQSKATEKAPVSPSKRTFVSVQATFRAIRYSPENGQVLVKCQAQHGTVNFSVSDNGPGIERKYLDRIFERFFQIPGTPSGTGLGLAISKEFIEAQGGKIIANSVLGKGTEFSFQLPTA